MSVNWHPNSLSNELVRLAPLDESDFERLYAVASDPLIWEQHPERERFMRPVFQKFFDGAIASGTAFLITDVSNREVMGTTRFYSYNQTNSSVAIGYTFLAIKYWGGSYNRAVKKLLLDYAFRYVEKVYFHIGSNNIRSMKATSKLGARYDRIVDFDHYGQNVPHLQYLIEKKDYDVIW